jgi:hypothetical protein
VESSRTNGLFLYELNSLILGILRFHLIGILYILKFYFSDDPVEFEIK